MKRDATRGQLDLLLLRILGAGPAHGYAIITSLRDRSDGLFDLTEGTVYPCLHRLEDAGLVQSDWDTSSGRRRRQYRLTAEGERSLAEGRAEWTRFVAGMNLVMGARA